MAKMLIFGLGYTAKRIASRLTDLGWEIEATGRDGNLDFADSAAVARALSQADHVISSVPPVDGRDPVLDGFHQALLGKWLGYLSSTGVYGDTSGAWVDESAAIGNGRRRARSLCDRAWLEQEARVFRLPGIYGPGRSAIDRVRAGKAQRIKSPGQVFSRVHVDDIVSGVLAALAKQEDTPPGAYNLADDLPCSQNAVVEEACRILGQKPPELMALDNAKLSSAARGFYAENRRVANGKAKRVLGWQPTYPDFRAGLAACV